MRIIASARQLPQNLPKPIVAIGTFDGVHLAHAAIIRRVVREARRRRGTSVIISFDPHPQHVLRPGHVPRLLTRVDERLELFRALGVQIVWLVRFTKAFARLSPEAFFARLLVRALHARVIVVGASFGFGRGRQGNLQLLQTLGRRAGIAVQRVPDVLHAGEPINSSRIRAAVAEGRFAEARQLLGRPVTLRGRVVHGASRGAMLGFPTANLAYDHVILPPTGVYAVRVRVGHRRRHGVANVGHRPTFEQTAAITVEAHLLRFRGRLYGRTVTLEWLAKLRDEQTFADRDALRRQIVVDIAAARRLLRRTNSPAT